MPDADPQLPAYDRPSLGIGLYEAAFERYAALLTERTGVPAKLEPYPVETNELALELVPAGLRVQRDGPNESWVEAPQRYQAEVSVVIALVGKGLGWLFVAECLDASARCVVGFDRPLNVELGPGRFATAQVTARPDGQGKFFESEGEGQDYVFERSWDSTLYLPLTLVDGEPTAGDTASPRDGIPVEVDLS